MSIRAATPHDAEAVAAIYAPIVRETAISFEIVPPSVDEMRSRIRDSLRRFPWLVSLDNGGLVNGYAYASTHRERAAYRWSADTTVYVRDDSRGNGVGKCLYLALLGELAQLGYFQAFAGIALPNPASIALHQSVGFESVGVYRRVGFKQGVWHDVGWWQRSLKPPAIPGEPVLFGARLAR